MDSAAKETQTTSTGTVSQPDDLHPLCCTAAMPAPASWEMRQRVVHRLRLDSHLARRSSFIAVAYAMVSVAIGLNMLTPLYGLYRQKFDFSALTLTLIFATYVVTII